MDISKLLLNPARLRIMQCKAEVMYWYGEKELKCVKKSGKLFKSYVQNCEIYEAKGYNHGYLALYLPDEWLELAEEFFHRNKGGGDINE